MTTPRETMCAVPGIRRVVRAPESDIDGIDPEYVVRHGCGALQTELRAHDARYDDDAERLVLNGRGRSLPSESGEIAVFSRTEVGDQLSVLRATD